LDQQEQLERKVLRVLLVPKVFRDLLVLLVQLQPLQDQLVQLERKVLLDLLVLKDLRELRVFKV
jgi:hypothetical protein